MEMYCLPDYRNLDMQDYSSPRNNEHVALGLYEVDLKRYGTSARLTALQRSAMHEYTFPASDDSKIIIDLGVSCLLMKDNI